MVGCKQRGVRATFQAHVDNFLVKLWNLVKIVKSGQNDQNCEIWLELLAELQYTSWWDGSGMKFKMGGMDPRQTTLGIFLKHHNFRTKMES